MLSTCVLRTIVHSFLKATIMKSSHPKGTLQSFISHYCHLFSSSSSLAELFPGESLPRCQPHHFPSSQAVDWKLKSFNQSQNLVQQPLGQTGSSNPRLESIACKTKSLFEVPLMNLVRDVCGEKVLWSESNKWWFQSCSSHGSTYSATFEVCSLLVRLPSGGRLQRRFARSSLLQEAGQMSNAVLGNLFQVHIYIDLEWFGFDVWTLNSIDVLV